MKKQLLTLTAIFILAIPGLSARAQTSKADSVDQRYEHHHWRWNDNHSCGCDSTYHHAIIGLRAGINLANTAVDPAPSGASMSIHTGLLAGAQFDYWLNCRIAVGAQVLFDQKGVHMDAGASGSSNSLNTVTNYLEVPLLLKLRFARGDLKPYIFAGPSFGLFLSGTTTTDISGQSSSHDVPSSTLTSPDVSFLFGAGVSYELGSGTSFFLDAGYALGITNINNVNPGQETDKTNDFRIAAGIGFALD